jgi:hypothetical protein
MRSGAVNFGNSREVQSRGGAAGPVAVDRPGRRGIDRNLRQTWVVGAMDATQSLRGRARRPRKDAGVIADDVIREPNRRLCVLHHVPQCGLSIEQRSTSQVFAIQPWNIEDMKHQTPLGADPHVALKVLEVMNPDSSR